MDNYYQIWNTSSIFGVFDFSLFEIQDGVVVKESEAVIGQLSWIRVKYLFLKIFNVISKLKYGTWKLTCHGLVTLAKANQLFCLMASTRFFNHIKTRNSQVRTKCIFNTNH